MSSVRANRKQNRRNNRYQQSQKPLHLKKTHIMVGNLFDEGAGDGPGFALGTAAIKQPPAPRGSTKLAGIWNQASTCFLNALVQNLSLVPEFRDGIFQLERSELGWDREESKQRIILIQLQRLFASLMMENQKAVSSQAVTSSFGWTIEQVRQQHDAQELFTVLLPALTKSLHGTSGQDLIRQLMTFINVQTISCEGCGNSTYREAKETTLFVQVQGTTKGLEEALYNCFCRPEVMNGADQYRCNVCGKKRNALKTLKIRSLPQLLMVSLNRFAYSPDFTPYKVVDRFPFPMDLDMSGYTEHNQPHPDLEYQLTGVIVHSGNLIGGHYTTYIRDVDGLGHWETVDDSTERQTAEQRRVKADVVDCDSPKEIVATVLSNLLQTSEAVSIDKLCMEIAKQTGQPWSKTYKQTHGSFVKFLKANTDTFIVDNKLVKLAENPVSSSRKETSDANTSPAVSPAPNPARRQPNPPRHISQPGQNWFFFNDANVSPAVPEDLKKQFGGRCCAYMLLYRRKNSPRPPEAFGNPAYNIPEHVMEEIRKINEELAKERESYEQEVQSRREEEERRKREVQLDLRYHFNYTVESGLLKTHSQPLVHSFPRTQTLAELRACVSMFASGSLTEETFRIHVMKCWGEKTHLYEELRDNDKTLEELSLENGTILFAWDGCQVDGHPVSTGAESEPLTLQLKEGDLSSSTVITHTFPKNLSLTEFQDQVSRLTDIHKDHLKFGLQPEAAESVEGAVTLEDLGLNDGACLVFFAAAPNYPTFGSYQNSQSRPAFSQGLSLPESTGEQFSVHIENRCDKNSKDSPVLKLNITNSMTVGEVKQTFMALYSLQYYAAALQENHPTDGLQHPYNEEMSVGEAGITSATQLVLDLTTRVVEFKLFPDEHPNQEALQVCVRKNCTVEECFLAMAEVAGLPDPAEWHMCTSTFMFERVCVLHNRDMLLDSSSHFFVLERGRLPARGCIAIPVWLYASPPPLGEHSNNVPEPHLDMEANKWKCARKCLGDIEIKKEARLEELMEQIADRLCSKNIHVSPRQLRLRMIEGMFNRPRKVLRDPHSTLRQLRLDHKTPVGVQIVPPNREPMKEGILLNVHVKDKKGGEYGPVHELLWDTKVDGEAATDLKRAIASKLNIDDDDEETTLIIAKHIPGEFSWRELENSNKPSSQGGRKKQKKKCQGTRRVCLPSVEDGDVVGIICLGPEVSSDSVKPVFCSAVDIEGRQLLEVARRKRRENQNGVPCSTARRPQPALSIKVSDYF